MKTSLDIKIARLQLIARTEEIVCRRVSVSVVPAAGIARLIRQQGIRLTLRSNLCSVASFHPPAQQTPLPQWWLISLRHNCIVRGMCHQSNVANGYYALDCFAHILTTHWAVAGITVS
jgi:hypothetical protein